MGLKSCLRDLEAFVFALLPSSTRTTWQAYKSRRKMNRQYGRRPDPFNYGAHSYERARFDAAEAALGERRWRKVLEAGCGEGYFTERLARHCDDVAAVDISAVALARARERVPAARYIEADLMTWRPPQDERYDLIVLADVLTYLDRPVVEAEFAALFERVVSWLAEGGRLLMVDGFANDQDFSRRRSYRERFVKAGLTATSDFVLPGAARNQTRCLLSVLDKPA